MSTQRFQPLMLGVEGEATGTIQVRCAVTGDRLPWNDAVRAGWVADTHAPAFSRYLSPRGLLMVELSNT